MWLIGNFSISLHNHPILAILLNQVFVGNAKHLNGFVKSPERIECPYFSKGENGEFCSYEIGDGYKILECEDDYGNMRKCDIGLSKLWPDIRKWAKVSDTILFHPPKTWRDAIASFPTHLVSFENNKTKEWLDGYCTCILNYYSARHSRPHLKNNEYALFQLCLDKFHISEEMKKQVLEKFNALREE